MAEVLVLVELNPGGSGSGAQGVRKTTLEALTAARALGEPSAVVVGAPGAASGAKDALAEYGAQKVYVAESADIDDYLVAPKAEVLAKLVSEKSPAAVVIPSSPEGKEVAARVALKTGSGFLTDVTEIASDGTATQVAFAGEVIVHSKVNTGTPIYTLRGNSVAPEPASGAASEETVDVSVSDAAKGTRVADRVIEQKSSRPELTEASIVVSGGRGVASAHRGAGRRARRRRRCLPRRGRLRLLPAHLPGRADRQDRLAAAVHRRRHLRGHPAPGRHADEQDDRRHQQGPRGADLRAVGLRRRR
jgi:electron transfer flavoprotein alpha subunit